MRKQTNTGKPITEPFANWGQYFALKISNPTLWKKWVKLYGHPPGKPKRDKNGKIINTDD